MRHALHMRILLLAFAACATTRPAPHVTGRFGVADWSSDLFSGRFCEHCGGGPMLYAIADSPDHSLAVVVELDGGRCGLGASWTEPLWPIGDARISYGRPGDMGIQAVKGEVEVVECTRQRAHLRFTATFDDGSTASGTIDTALDFDAGYE